MKKVLLLLSVIMFATSCQGPPGRDGLDGVETYWYVKVYTVNSNQWQLVGGVDQLNSYYKAELIIPELTRKIYEDGNIFCYMFQNQDGIEVQTLLPYHIPFGENTNGNEYLWSETYAYDFTPGSVMLYVNYSDFYTGNRPPTVSFRVVLNY
jgi:hypothetical protein